MFQEKIPKSLEEVVKELRGTRSELFYGKCVLKIPKNSQKNVLVRAETCNRG